MLIKGGILLKIPSQYVEERFKNIDNQLNTGRRKRNSQYYKNCTFIWIRNIIIFYVLFIIGMFLMYMYTDILQSITFGSYNKTNCSCQYVKASDSNPKESINVNNTYIKYIPIPPKFWQQHLDNLTNIVVNTIDEYFRTSGAQYIENSTDIIVNKTIDRLQKIQLSSMYIDEIQSKIFYTNTLTTDTITTNTLTTDTITTNTLTTDSIYSSKINTTDLYGTNLYGTDSIYSSKINTTDLYGTNLYGTNLFGVNIFGTNLTTSIINTINIITDTVQSIELFGNTLNKCTVGKC